MTFTLQIFLDIKADKKSLESGILIDFENSNKYQRLKTYEIMHFRYFLCPRKNFICFFELSIINLFTAHDLHVRTIKIDWSSTSYRNLIYHETILVLNVINEM